MSGSKEIVLVSRLVSRDGPRLETRLAPTLVSHSSKSETSSKSTVVGTRRILAGVALGQVAEPRVVVLMQRVRGISQVQLDHARACATPSSPAWSGRENGVKRRRCDSRAADSGSLRRISRAPRPSRTRLPATPRASRDYGMTRDETRFERRDAGARGM